MGKQYLGGLSAVTGGLIAGLLAAHYGLTGFRHSLATAIGAGIGALVFLSVVLGGDGGPPSS